MSTTTHDARTAAAAVLARYGDRRDFNPRHMTLDEQGVLIDAYAERMADPPDGSDLARLRRRAAGEADQAGELAANRAKLQNDYDHARAVVQAAERLALAGKDVEWDKVAVAQAVIATAPDILRRMGPEVGHAKDRATSVRIALDDRTAEARRLLDEAAEELAKGKDVPLPVWNALAVILGPVGA